MSKTATGVTPPTSSAHRRWTCLIAPPSSPSKVEHADARSPLSKAHTLHRPSLSLNLTTHTARDRQSGPWSASPVSTSSAASLVRPRSRPLRTMLSRINTSTHSPDRPTRRPHGPRSACSPAVSSAKSASRTHYHDIWKARAGPSTIRTSPPQLSLP